MKIKYPIMALAAAIIVASGAFFLRPSLSERFAVKTGLLRGSKQAPKEMAVVKKAFAKNMGGLNVRALNARNRQNVLMVKAFKSEGSSSIYVRSFISGKTQELAPGIYDIELNTVPQKIFKGIKVSAGEETLEALNCVTGSLNIKISDYKNNPAFFPVSVYHPKTNIKIASGVANRPLELLAGVYDIEIAVLPKITQAAVIIEPGKEKSLDLGVLTGALIVRALDQNKAEKIDARQSVRIRRADTNELLINTRINRAVEIGPGKYNVEIDTIPPQISKDIKVITGKEAVVEVLIQAPSQAKPGKT